MSCQYYSFRNRDYYCAKIDKYVSTDVYNRYCRKYDYDDCPVYKGDSDGSNCFITTACVKAKNLPDDCEELTVLRSFRDSWLKNQPFGEKEIAEYYALAPAIVDKINNQSTSIEIWDGLYHNLVIPCVEMIKAGEFEKAYVLYKATSLNLEKQYSAQE